MKRCNYVKLIGVIILSTLPLTGFSGTSSDTLRIRGSIPNVKDKLVVYAIDYGAYLGKVLDTITVQKGEVNASIYLNKPTYIMLFEPYDKHTATKIDRIRFPGIPGEEIIIKGNMDDYSIYGSAFYKDYSRVNTLMQDIYRQNNMSDSLRIKVLEYVKRHSDEEATATLLTFLSDEFFSTAVECLSECVRNGRMSVYIQANIEQRRIRKAMDDSREKIRLGMKAPVFSCIDIKGNPLSLSSFLGKYVLLDFWGAWCGPCMKGMPILKEYYDKYRGKLEIIGIDCRDNKQKWKDTVIKNQLIWYHVQDGADSNITTRYAVESFPTLVLIDKDGFILYKTDRDKESIFTYLDELLDNENTKHF